MKVKTTRQLVQFLNVLLQDFQLFFGRYGSFQYFVRPVFLIINISLLTYLQITWVICIEINYFMHLQQLPGFFNFTIILLLEHSKTFGAIKWLVQLLKYDCAVTKKLKHMSIHHVYKVCFLGAQLFLAYKHFKFLKFSSSLWESPKKAARLKIF